MTKNKNFPRNAPFVSSITDNSNNFLLDNRTIILNSKTVYKK